MQADEPKSSQVSAAHPSAGDLLDTKSRGGVVTPPEPNDPRAFICDCKTRVLVEASQPEGFQCPNCGTRYRFTLYAYCYRTLFIQADWLSYAISSAELNSGSLGASLVGPIRQ